MPRSLIKYPPTAMFGQIETGDEITVELDLFFVT